MTDLTDLKSRLSGAVALDDVKQTMAEALKAIEMLERELEFVLRRHPTMALLAEAIEMELPACLKAQP